MRLIDADELFKRMESTGWWNNCDRDDIAEELVLSAPTIDAVEVVRCKECRYGITAHGISNGWVLCSKPYTERGNAMHRTDWFCAYGEEKNDDTRESNRDFKG